MFNIKNKKRCSQTALLPNQNSYVTHFWVVTHKLKKKNGLQCPYPLIWSSSILLIN